METRYDVVIVGASIAGCTAAVLYGRAGLKVALVERSPDLRAWKKVCTHFIQASAVPTLQRLGLTERMEAAGAVRSSAALWTRYGWITPDLHATKVPPYGYSLQRERLDPMMRDLARETSGVELMLGTSVQALIRDDSGRICGVEVTSEGQPARRLTARLIVGADGRNSKVAQLAEVPADTRPHHRFGYSTYYRNLTLASPTTAQLWLLDPDCAYAFPNPDGLTLIAFFVHKDRLPEFRKDLEGSMKALFRGLADGPDLERGERVSDFVGMIDMPNVYRTPDWRGLALIGDAALSSDPLWGVGCGWALQSAEWLVDATAEAIARGAELTAPLAAYREKHRRILYPVHAENSAYSLGTKFDPGRKLVFSAAPHVNALKQILGRQVALEITPRQAAAAAIPHALWFHARRMVGLADATPPRLQTS